MYTYIAIRKFERVCEMEEWRYVLYTKRDIYIKIKLKKLCRYTVSSS